MLHDRVGKGVDQAEHAAHRLFDGGGPGAAHCRDRCHQRTMLRDGAHQAGREGRQRHPIRIQGVDALRDGGHQLVDGALTHAGPDEFAHRHRVGTNLRAERQVAGQLLGVVVAQGAQCWILDGGRDAEHALGHRPRTVRPPDVRLPGRALHLEAEFVAELPDDAAAHRVGLGSGIDGDTAQLHAPDHAAQLRAGFEHVHGTASLSEPVARDQPGQTAADDEGRHSECRKATSSVSTPGSVVGGTP